MIINNIFYNKLRTDKQLGYLVSLSYTKIYNEYYIIEKIQSTFDYNILNDSILNFNKNILNYINKINIKNWIITLTNHLQTKDININAVYYKYYYEIKIREFKFKRNEELLLKIKNISVNSLNTFIKKYIVDNKNILSIFIEKN